MLRTFLFTASLLALSSCSSHTSADAQADATTAVTAQPAAAKQKTVIDDQLKALEKARAVGDQLEKEKQDHDKVIDDQGS
ncbi:MAG: hypothetical protein ABIQ70_04570 [Dokdonella sp.]